MLRVGVLIEVVGAALFDNLLIDHIDFAAKLNTGKVSTRKFVYQY